MAGLSCDAQSWDLRVFTHLRQGSKSQKLITCTKSPRPEIPNPVWTPALTLVSWHFLFLYRTMEAIHEDATGVSVICLGWKGLWIPHEWVNWTHSSAPMPQPGFCHTSYKKPVHQKLNGAPSLGPTIREWALLTFSWAHTYEPVLNYFPKNSSSLWSEKFMLPVAKVRTKSHPLSGSFLWVWASGTVNSGVKPV